MMNRSSIIAFDQRDHRGGPTLGILEMNIRFAPASTLVAPR